MPSSRFSLFYCLITRFVSSKILQSLALSLIAVTTIAKVALFLIDGFEETEALATVDILRRGEVDMTTISLTNKERVMGKHSVPVVADALFEDAKDGPFDMLVVPGGTIE